MSSDAMKLARKFAKDYYGDYFRSSDATPHAFDKDLVEFPVGYGQRLYVNVKTGQVFWHASNVVADVKARKLGYRIKETLLFGVKYFIIEGKEPQDSPNFDSLKSFLQKAKTSRKAEELGFVSVRNYYEFLTKRKSLTKTLKEPKLCRDWMLNVWRPFSKTLTNDDWERLGVSPILGRDGYIALFKYKEV